MARFSAAWRTAGAGSTTLPIASLIGSSSRRIQPVEVHAFNTTATAVVLALRLCTALGGTHAGAASAAQKESDTGATALATLIDTDTGTTPTITAGNLRVLNLGASIGSGIILTFGNLWIPATANSGIVLVPLTGTGQICDVAFVWDE